MTDRKDWQVEGRGLTGSSLDKSLWKRRKPSALGGLRAGQDLGGWRRPGPLPQALETLGSGAVRRTMEPLKSSKA